MERHPVWESVLDDEADEASEFPVLELPASDFGSRLIGSRVRRANGSLGWAMIMGLDTQSARKNKHLLQLRSEKGGEWFWLARYWDVDYESAGPAGLAKFLELPSDEIFPISYGVRNCPVGALDALVNSVPAVPEERLATDEIIKMIVRGLPCYHGTLD